MTIGDDEGLAVVVARMKAAVAGERRRVAIARSKWKATRRSRLLGSVCKPFFLRRLRYHLTRSGTEHVTRNH